MFETKFSLKYLALVVAITTGGARKIDGASLISVPPKSFNANLGGEAIFTCVIHENVSDVLWIVRGVERSEYTSSFSDDDTITAILTIPTVAEENDGAEVVCKPFTFGGATEESEPAILRVQGLLDAPGNLAITNMETDAITLTWEAPLTLDLTGIHPDIINYTVFIELNSSHFWCDNVTETEYTFTGTVQGQMLDPCSVYQFSVRARNVVGEGSRSERVEGSLHRSQPEIESATTNNIYFDQNASPKLSTKLKVRAGNFFSCTPVTIIASVTCERHQSCQKQFDPTPTDDQLTNIVISDPECIPHNTFCIGTFTATNDAGTSPPFGLPEFSTFDVQLVEVEMSDDTITITCHFAQGSAALGCHIQFLPTEQDNEYEECTMRAIRDKASQNLSEAISGLPAGTYYLMVHDIEGNSLLSETHAYQHPSVITSNGTFPGSSELHCKLITEEEDNDKGSSSSTDSVGIVLGVALGAVLLVAAAVTVIIIILCIVHRNKKRGNVTAAADVEMRQNATYETVGVWKLQQQCVSQMEPCPAYAIPKRRK